MLVRNNPDSSSYLTFTPNQVKNDFTEVVGKIRDREYTDIPGIEEFLAKKLSLQMLNIINKFDQNGSSFIYLYEHRSNIKDMDKFNLTFLPFQNGGELKQQSDDFLFIERPWLKPFSFQLFVTYPTISKKVLAVFYDYSRENFKKIKTKSTETLENLLHTLFLLHHVTYKIIPEGLKLQPNTIESIFNNAEACQAIDFLSCKYEIHQILADKDYVSYLISTCENPALANSLLGLNTIYKELEDQESLPDHKNIELDLNLLLNKFAAPTSKKSLIQIFNLFKSKPEKSVTAALEEIRKKYLLPTNSETITESF